MALRSDNICAENPIKNMQSVVRDAAERVQLVAPDIAQWLGAEETNQAYAHVKGSPCRKGGLTTYGNYSYVIYEETVV